MEAVKLEFQLLVHFGFHLKNPRRNAETVVCVVVEHLLVGCVAVPPWYKRFFFVFPYTPSWTVAEVRAGLYFQGLL